MKSPVYVFLFAAVVGAAALLPLKGQAATLTACVANLNGTARIVPSPRSCIAGVERAIQFNQTGPAGPQGPAGATGAQGATGTQGAKGATGAQGAPGATGATGTISAVAIYSASATYSHGQVVVCSTSCASNGSTYYLNAATSSGQDPSLNSGPGQPYILIAQAGAMGAPGPTGATGLMGASGPAGATGPTGPSGPTGPPGPTGAAGGQVWSANLVLPANYDFSDGYAYFVGPPLGVSQAQSIFSGQSYGSVNLPVPAACTAQNFRASLYVSQSLSQPVTVALLATEDDPNTPGYTPLNCNLPTMQGATVTCTSNATVKFGSDFYLSLFVTQAQTPGKELAGKELYVSFQCQ